MAIDTFLEKYTGAALTSRGVVNLARFHILEPGTITDLDIWVASMFGSNWLFQWRINGVAQFVAGSRPSVSNGAEHSNKTGLSIVVAKGDIVSCDFEVVGSSGAINSPIDFGVTITDNGTEVEGPGTAADGSIVLFDGVSGGLIKDSGAAISTDGAFAANSDAKVPTEKAVKTYVGGRVAGPGSAIDNAIPLFDGTTGKLIKDSAKTISTDGTLAGNSDSIIPTQKAVKAYADQLIAAADAMRFRGVINCSANPNYPAADAGDTYRVSVAGKIGGASGTNVEIGDQLLCLTDSTAAGNQATVGANWNITQANIDGAVVGPTSATDAAIALFNGTGGKIIKDSAKIISIDGTLAGNSDSNIPTEKAVKTYVTSAVAGVGGGATLDTWFDTPPASPNALDDEFNAGSLDAKWTNGGTHTGHAFSVNALPAKSCFMASFGTADGDYVLTQAYTPGSSDFSITAKMSTEGFNNFQGMALWAGDPAGTALRLATYNGTSAFLIHKFPAFSAVGGAAGPNLFTATDPPGWIFMHIQRKSNVYTFWFSRNGIAWIQHGGTTTDSFTVTKVGFAFFQSGATTAHLGFCDWFRVNYLFK